MVAIRIEGFSDDLRAAGEAEIREILEAFQSIAPAIPESASLWRLDHIDEVLVTPSIEEVVREHLRPELGDIADTYRSARHGMSVQGYTASRIEGEELRSRLILAADGMGDWQPPSRLYRTMTLCHEVFHAVLRRSRFERDGPRGPREEWRVDDLLSVILGIATEEYRVDKLTDRFIYGFFRDDQGRPIETHRLMVAAGWGYLDGAIGIVNAILNQFIQAFWKLDRGEIDIVGHMNQTSNFIVDVMAWLAHLSAVHDSLDGWAEDEAQFMASDGYSRFLFDAWPKVHQFWLLKWDSDDQAAVDAVEADAQTAVKSIFARCGVDMTDIEDGIYWNATLLL